MAENPAHTHPAASPKTYPYPIPQRETMPPTPTPGAGDPHGLRPDAGPAASNALNLDSTNAVAAVYPVAGGNLLNGSGVVAPAGGICGPAEKIWAESKDETRGQAVVDAFRAQTDPQFSGYTGPTFDPNFRPGK